jgi:carboxypeptidase Taq
VAEIPGAWNERMRSDLGLEVPDDRRGCLQDIHWAMGGIGYFPTYTLGNLYAAQLWASIGEQLPGLDEEVRKGEFGSLLSWLRREVHQHGRRYAAEDLCMRATGAPLQARPLLDYLQAKLGPLYGV